MYKGASPLATGDVHSLPLPPLLQGRRPAALGGASVLQLGVWRPAALGAWQSSVSVVLRARMASASNFSPRSSVPLKGGAFPKRPLPGHRQSLVQSPSCVPTHPHSGQILCHRYKRILADMMTCSSRAAIRNASTCDGRHCSGPKLLRISWLFVTVSVPGVEASADIEGTRWRIRGGHFPARSARSLEPARMLLLLLRLLLQ